MKKLRRIQSQAPAPQPVVTTALLKRIYENGENENDYPKFGTNIEPQQQQQRPIEPSPVLRKLMKEKSSKKNVNSCKFFDFYNRLH